MATVRRLISEAQDRRLLELCDAYQGDRRPGVQAAVAAGRARHNSVADEALRLEGLYRLENDLRARGFASIAGIDEVGRGALAGPLTVGAVILPARPLIEGLDDSKRLTPGRREEVDSHVREIAIAYTIVHVPATEVDSRGLSNALKSAMLEAVRGLAVSVDHVLVDGNPLSIFDVETAIVGGDRKVATIAAASVIAKVERDALMRAHDEEYPAYGFALNKGYGTREHLDAIAVHGPSALHRRTFCPGGGTQSLF